MACPSTVVGMKNTTLIRSIPYWLLIVLSLGALGYGGWITTSQIDLMTSTLLDGTATGVEVYAGQAWVVFGGALVAGGFIGLALALAIAAAKSLVARPRVEVVEAIDWSADDDAATASPVDETATDGREEEESRATDTESVSAR
jgi:hypothetical protein